MQIVILLPGGASKIHKQTLTQLKIMPPGDTTWNTKDSYMYDHKMGSCWIIFKVPNYKIFNISNKIEKE